MNCRRRRNNSPPGTGGVARSAGVVDGSNNSPPHSFIGIKENHFDFTTTPALRASPPVPGGELFLSLLQFIHTFCDRAYSHSAWVSSCQASSITCAGGFAFPSCRVRVRELFAPPARQRDRTSDVPDQSPRGF